MSVILAPAGSVVLIGDAVQGSTLKAVASLPDLGSASSLSYRWSANGQWINGPSGNTLVLDSTLVGQSISCTVSYQSQAGTTQSLQTEATAPVAANLPPQQLLAWSPFISAMESTSFAWTVPDASVQDPENKVLSWSASLSNGNALPAWLQFDSSKLTLQGTPNAGTAGNYSVVLKAADPYGLQWSSTPLQLSVLSLPSSTGNSVFEFRNASLKDKWLSFDVVYTGASKLLVNSLEFSLQMPAGVDKVTASKNTGWAFMPGTDNSDLLLLAPTAKSLVSGNLVSHFDIQLDAYVSSLPLSLSQDGLRVNQVPAAIPGAVVLTQPQAPKVQSGVVQDGYLVNALVWIDENGDGQWTREALIDKNNNQQVDEGEYWDANGNGFFDAEPWTITDARGNFDGLVGTGTLKIQGWTFNADGSLPTVDLSTGKTFKGSYSAPDGAKVINPITTLVQTAVSAGQTAEQAQTLVKSVLGVSETVDLLNFDPVASSQNSAQAADALKVQKTALQVANLMQVAVDTTQSAGATNVVDVVNSVSASLIAAANATASGKTLDLGSAALISSTLNAAADVAVIAQDSSTAKTILKAQSQGIGTALSEVNTSIESMVNTALNAGSTSGKLETASTLVNIVAAQIVAQEQVSAQAQTAVAQSLVSGNTGASNITLDFDQSLGVALSKVGRVFVTQTDAAPLAVNDQVRLSLPAGASNTRTALTAQGSVLNNDTADSSFSKTIGTAAAGLDAALRSVGSYLSLSGQFGSLLLRSDGTFTYTEDPTKTSTLGANQSVTDVFRYEIVDGAGVDERKSSATLTIALDRINLPPSAPLSQTVFKLSGEGLEGDSIKALNLLGNATDPEQDALTTSAVQIGTQALGSLQRLKTTYGEVTIKDGVLHYQPDASSAVLMALNEGQSLKEMLTYTISDASNAPVPAVMQLVIQGSNDAPVLQRALVDQVVQEGRTLAYTWAPDTFSDVDNPQLSYTATLGNGDALPAWLLFDATSRSLTARPGTDVVGNAPQTWTVHITASDAAGATVSGDLDLTISPAASGVNVGLQTRYWSAGASGGQPLLQGVRVSHGNLTSDPTDVQGRLTLPGLQDTDGVNDARITLTPQLTTPANARSAITLVDVLGALKVYLEKDKSSALKYVAADFDGNGKVELGDVLSLLKFYLNKPNAPVTPSWAFVDAADITNVTTVLGANGQPLSKTNTNPMHIDLPTDVDQFNVELVGVLRGDVDGSWTG